MTETLHGIQVTNRCAWYDGQRLCGEPAPYLVTGSSFCALHALERQQRHRSRAGMTGGMSGAA